jgi:hypothetical protein
MVKKRSHLLQSQDSLTGLLANERAVYKSPSSRDIPAEGPGRRGERGQEIERQRERRGIQLVETGGARHWPGR